MFLTVHLIPLIQLYMVLTAHLIPFIQLLYGSYSAPDSYQPASLSFPQCIWFLSSSFSMFLTVHLIPLIQLYMVLTVHLIPLIPLLYVSHSAFDSSHPAYFYFWQCTRFLSTCFFKFLTVQLIPLIPLIFISDSAPGSSHPASSCFWQCSCVEGHSYLSDMC